MSTPTGSYDTLDALDAASADTSAPVDFTPATVPVDFVSEQGSPLVSFLTANVPPPSPLYVNLDDIIAVTVTNSLPNLSLTVSYRLLRVDGQIVVASQTFIPASDRSPTGVHLNVPEGWLLGICVQASGGGLTRGQCYVTIGVQRPATQGVFRQLQLCSDYLSTRYILGWPGGVNRDSAEGPGAPIVYLPANPAAGAEIIQVAPTVTRWTLQSIRFALTTSAAVGNRTVQFGIQDGFNHFFYLMNAATLQAPSTTVTYVVSPNGFAPSGAGYLAEIPLPPVMRLPLGAGWSTSTGGLDVGDQYSNIVYLVEELFD